MKKLTVLLIMLILLLAMSISGCYSCKTYHKLKDGSSVPTGCEEEFFWADCCFPEPAKPAPAPAPKPKAEPCDKCESVRIDKNMPRVVRVNSPFEYTITVTNLSCARVTDVVLTEQLARNFKLAGTNPQAHIDGSKLMWALGTLDPGQSKTVTVKGAATTTETLKHCATVTYVVTACGTTQVVEPKLKLTKTAPAEVSLCDPIPVKFIISNPGTGTVDDVKIVDQLPSGLTTADGKSSIVYNVGTLAVGQSKEFAATLKASKTGSYVNKATATASDGLSTSADTKTMVRQPVLTVEKTGPDRRYIGRQVTYDIVVTNKGDAVAKDVVVVDALPTDAKSVSASSGGKISQGKVTWNLGSLAPNSSQKVSVSLTADNSGTLTNTARATAYCAAAASDSAETTIAGIPAVLLEVIDVEDPVELGNNETYVITATNQGSSPDTNISIICTLEDAQQYASSSGVTTATLEGNQVKFAPLSTLAPKTKATWRVTIKAVKSGDVRFKVTMNTDQTSRPVEETESTHQYE
ncbi:MAG: DUF11 domain-containing protein [Sedimentisphaerales bacterium]|nr:DUF11 domain-containing protein [Sedimentisphaerales bacterium]